MKEETINLAAFEGIDDAERELIISKLIVEVHDWLTAANEDPTVPVWEFSSTRAYMADIFTTTRRFGLDRDVVLDAKMVLRLAERAVGKAVRRAQAAGELGSLATNNAGTQNQYAAIKGEKLPSPQPYVGYGTTANGIYKMTDNVTDAQFGAVLKEARAEEKLSRMYIVRRLTELRTGRKVETRPDLLQQTRNLSEQLRRLTVKLRTLSNDDRLDRNKAEVAARMRPYLDTAVAVCTDLKKKLDEQ